MAPGDVMGQSHVAEVEVGDRVAIVDPHDVSVVFNGPALLPGVKIPDFVPRQRPVVNADIVDVAVKGVVQIEVGTYSENERTGRRGERSVDGILPHAVDVDAGGCTVVGDRKLMPLLIGGNARLHVGAAVHVAPPGIVVEEHYSECLAATGGTPVDDVGGRHAALPIDRIAGVGVARAVGDVDHEHQHVALEPIRVAAPVLVVVFVFPAAHARQQRQIAEQQARVDHPARLHQNRVPARPGIPGVVSLRRHLADDVLAGHHLHDFPPSGLVDVGRRRVVSLREGVGLAAVPATVVVQVEVDPHVSFARVPLSVGVEVGPVELSVAVVVQVEIDLHLVAAVRLHDHVVEGRARPVVRSQAFELEHRRRVLGHELPGLCLPAHVAGRMTRGVECEILGLTGRGNPQSFWAKIPDCQPGHLEGNTVSPSGFRHEHLGYRTHVAAIHVHESPAFGRIGLDVVDDHRLYQGRTRCGYPAAVLGMDLSCQAEIPPHRGGAALDLRCASRSARLRQAALQGDALSRHTANSDGRTLASGQPDHVTAIVSASLEAEPPPGKGCGMGSSHSRFSGS